MLRFTVLLISSVSLCRAIQNPENITSRRSQNAVNFFPDDTQQENYNTAHGGANANDVSSFRFQDDQRDLNQNEILVSPAQKFQQSPYQRPHSPYYLAHYANPGAVANNPRPNPYAGAYGYYSQQEDNRVGSSYSQAPYPFQRPQQVAGQFGGAPNYAAQFANNYRPGGSANFPGNFQQVGTNSQYDSYRQQPPPLVNVGEQFGHAIENIARFDDLQCVPKILCQMVGNPNRQSRLPAFLSAPSLTALISALPSTSPALIFGRAALLGFSGGESRCDSAYPRCPKNEDEILNYLNNHRGGFFRFFNGGASFGDEFPNYQQDYRPGYQQQDYRPGYQQQDYRPGYQQQINSQGPTYSQNQQTNFDLSSLSALLQGGGGGSQSGGINLSNLGSLASLIGSGGSQSSGASSLSSLGALGSNSLNLGSLASLLGGGGGQSSGIGSLSSLIGGSGSQSSQSDLSQLVGNLLTGLVGARFAGRSTTYRRRLQKRSVDDKPTGSFNSNEEVDKLLKSFSEKSAESDTKITSKKRNLNDELGNLGNNAKEKEVKKKKYIGEIPKKDHVKTLQKLLSAESRIVKLDKQDIEAEDRILSGVDSLEAEERILSGMQMPSFHHMSLNPVIFPQEYLYVSSEEANKIPKLINFGPPSGLQFPNQLQLQAAEMVFPQKFYPEPYQNQDGIILDIPKPLPLEYYDRTKMIFPDRTGTGNLRFDNDFFAPEATQGPTRFGRILTGSKRPQEGTYTGFGGNSANTITYNNGDILVLHQQHRLQPSYQQFQQSGFQQQYPVNFGGQYASSSHNYQFPQISNTYPTHTDSSGKVYVTNSLGVTEYYINAQGQKIRL